MPETLSGTYSPDSPATGRGSITVPSLKYGIGTLNLEYYVIDSSNVLFIEGDSSQVGLGTFQLQNAASSPAMAQPAISVFRPIIRPHAALRRKQ